MPKVLREISLSTFIAYLVPPHASSMEKLVLLSLVNNRVCNATEQSTRLLSATLSTGGMEKMVTVYVEHQILQKQATALSTSFGNFESMCIYLLFLRRLTEGRQSLDLKITLHPSWGNFTFFNEKIAYRFGRKLTELLPYARIFLESHSGFTHVTMVYGRIFVEQILPLLQNFEGHANDILSLIDSRHLDRLHIINHGMFLKTCFYAPSLFHIGPRTLQCETWFHLHNFCCSRFPIQPRIENILCGLDLKISPHEYLYNNIFEEIKECLPNLKQLIMQRARVEVDAPQSRGELQSQHLRYQREVKNVSSHILQIAQNSHITTDVTVTFPLYRAEDSKEVSAIFARFLPGITDVCEEQRSPFTVKMCRYTHNNTTTKIEFQKY